MSQDPGLEIWNCPIMLQSWITCQSSASRITSETDIFNINVSKGGWKWLLLFLSVLVSLQNWLHIKKIDDKLKSAPRHWRCSWPAGLAGSDLISNFLILFSTYLIRLLSEAIFQVFTKILKWLESGVNAKRFYILKIFNFCPGCSGRLITFNSQ